MSILSALLSGNPLKLAKALKPDPDLQKAAASFAGKEDGARRASAANDPNVALGVPLWIWIVGGVVVLLVLMRKRIGGGYRRFRGYASGLSARFRRRFRRRR